MYTRFVLRGVAGALVVVASFLCRPAPGVEFEDGPTFMTDSHGAAGVAMCMLSLADSDPKYRECAEQTLAWLAHVCKKDSQGRVAWFLSESAAPGSRNRRIMLPGQPMAISMFFEAHEQTERPEYRDVGLAAARWLAEEGADRRETRLGTAYGWGWVYGSKDAGHVAGHSHGLGKYMQALTTAYQVEPDAVFRDALRGALVRLKISVKDFGDGCHPFPSFPFPHGDDPHAIRTGYCYGQAGVIIPLMKLARAMPDLKLDDGTTPLELGNGSLRYLMSVAEPRLGGYVWPYMRHDRKSVNPGFGSGTGGIGIAFLEGYRTNLEHGDRQFADECMKHARGAADYALALVDRVSAKRVMTGGGGSAGFGVCGGAGATAHLPALLADEIGDEDPEFRERVKKTTGKIARLVIDRGVPVGNTLAWPLNAGERKRFEIESKTLTVNMSLDYGQTGVVFELSEMGKYLEDEEILDAARRAADFIIDNAVKTEHGWKVARFVHVRP